MTPYMWTTINQTDIKPYCLVITDRKQKRTLAVDITSSISIDYTEIAYYDCDFNDVIVIS